MSFREKFHQRPLLYILMLALAARLLAVFFARGFMMHDDHFLTIEPAASWADGKNFNDWLPGINNEREHPEPISFFYLGFLFVLFKVFHFIGIEHPDMQMYLIRFVHACFSLLTVYYAFKITDKISDRKNAIQAGMLLALLAVMPNFSVRNLVEMICMPPLLAGYWLLLKYESRGSDFKFPSAGTGCLIAGALLMGCAVGLRYQAGLFVALVGLVLFIQRGFLNATVFGLVSLFAFAVTQADDILLWGGQPFQHLTGYFQYNQKHANDYPGSPYAYLSFITLFILPPISLFLLFGFVRVWKKYVIFSLPTLGFLLFHIIYPNRQERFILPALPFFVMLGVIGWSEFVAKSKFWLKNMRMLKSCYAFFWTINLAVMSVFCLTYSKQARVEAMLYLYNQGDCKNFVREATHAENASMPPQFYSGDEWPVYYFWNMHTNVEQVMADFENQQALYAGKLHKRPVPNYYLFYDDIQLNQRVQRIQLKYPSLQHVHTIEAGWFDKLLHVLNDKNAVERIHIYKVNELP